MFSDHLDLMVITLRKTPIVGKVQSAAQEGIMFVSAAKNKEMKKSEAGFVRLLSPPPLQ